MFGKKTHDFEVLAYQEETQRPVRMERTTLKREALKMARDLSKTYPLVEGNILHYEDGSPVGDEVLCVYRNGIRTA